MLKQILIPIWIIFLTTPILLNAPATKSRAAKKHARANRASTISGEMLQVHNSIRSKMKIPPLQWSGELEAYSQKWANMLAAKNSNGHNPNSPYGENIFVAGPGSTPARVVQEWASESADYLYRTNTCAGDDCGHYTQIVWRSSRRIGCGVARSSQREVWVCSYDPPGNYRNEWPY